MSPVDLRDLIGDIREALKERPPETLVEILTYVFKEYVVEGSPMLAATPPALAEDFSGLSFAQVIEALQLRLDLPELALFQVQGERVFLQLGGRQIPIEAQAARPEPLPATPPPAPPLVSSPPTSPAPASQAGAVAEPMRTPGTSRAPAPAAAPRPVASPMTPASATGSRGNTAIPGGAPSTGSASTPSATPAAAAENAPGRTGARPAAPATEETVDNSGRFNLLEID
jgi:hypothetical protein